jgi:spore coat protein U-like protein
MRNLLRLFAVCTAIAPLAAFAQLAASENLTVTATVKATCAVSTAPITFSDYDPIADSGRTNDAALTITCTKGKEATIGLSNGGNFDATAGRRMKDAGSNYIAYDLFKTSAAAPGDRFGSVGAERVGYTGVGKAPDSTVRVYGVIAAGQDAADGTYTDTIVVDITF